MIHPPLAAYSYQSLNSNGIENFAQQTNNIQLQYSYEKITIITGFWNIFPVIPFYQSAFRQ